ncbi:hypothetical protein [Luteimonas sp. gir]|uniref:hypothetical protein n=1 Tax=Luteimonas sp. gir TaxID=3127960 RepID=UPI003075BB40
MEGLKHRHARQTQELDALLQATKRGRRVMRGLLSFALLLGGGASIWLLISLGQIINQGFVVECARMSTIDCRHAGPSEGAFWLVVSMRGFMLLLVGSASAFAALMMRATLKPAPNVEAARARLQRLEASIAQAEKAQVDSED